jgi:hypothetical protein
VGALSHLQHDRFVVWRVNLEGRILSRPLLCLCRSFDLLSKCAGGDGKRGLASFGDRYAIGVDFSERTNKVREYTISWVLGRVLHLGGLTSFTVHKITSVTTVDAGMPIALTPPDDAADDP